MKRPGLRATLAAATVVILALALAACHPKESAPSAPRPVVALPVHPDGIAPAATLPGQIAARYTTPLSFRIAGKIVERRVRLGDTVKAGEVLARLDASDVRKNAASAQAQLDAASHNLAFAKQQLERDRAQASANLIAPAQLEQTQNAYAAALAQRDDARERSALARDQLRYADLVADHAGVVTAEEADTGQNVSAGQAVYQLAWSGATDVVTDVPESALAQIAPGSTASVTLPALPGRTFDARVREIAPAADPQSRTYRVKLTLAAPDAAVRLGMTANVSFPHAAGVAGAASSTGTKGTKGTKGTTGTGTLYTLPATALFHDGAAPAVWIVAPNDTLELRRVTVASYRERTVDVSSGLSNGERVVLQGVHTVSAGEKVRPVAPLHAEDLGS